MRSLGLAPLAAVAALWLAPAAAAQPLLDAAEGAALVVTGTIAASAPVDRHARRARLAVERTPFDAAATAAATPAATASGRSLVIAWEDLALERAPRFVDGDRVLVALLPLPTASLWRQRFPRAEEEVWVVAGGSEAQVKNPTAAEVEALAEYLALDPGRRWGASGGRALARLVRHSPAMAGDALLRLADANRAAALDAESLALLSAVVADEKRARSDRAAIVELAGRYRVLGLRPALEAQARPGRTLEPEAVLALAALDGEQELDPARARALLRRDDPLVRAAGARLLRGDAAERELPRLARDDKAPAVRLAAAETLAASGTIWGIEGAIEALRDRDPLVRSGASRALAARGSEAIPYLKAQLDKNTAAAPGAIVTLSLMGPDGMAIVAQAARTHPDEHVRALARLALGDAGGHAH